MMAKNKMQKGNLFNKTENVQGNFHYHHNELYKKNMEKIKKEQSNPHAHSNKFIRSHSDYMYIDLATIPIAEKNQKNKEKETKYSTKSRYSRLSSLR